MTGRRRCRCWSSDARDSKCWDVLAPHGTPPEITERVATILLETLRQPTLHEQLRSLGFEVIGNGPDGLRRRIELEVPAYRDLIAKIGIGPV